MHIVSVAICTWNRCNSLRQVLDRLTKLIIPSRVQWELLIVNNNCTDATDEVIDSYLDRLPIRSLVEPIQGLSNARNCALNAATGDYIFWIDDDVLVEDSWLLEYMNALEAYPDAAYFGGTVEPWFEVEPPLWLRRHLNDYRLQGAYAIRRLGGVVRPFSVKEYPYGANIGFRTDVLKHYQFNPNLGRSGGGMLAGEEIDIINQFRKAGYQGIWVGTACVHHYIPAARLTKNYIWEHHRGVSRSRLQQEPDSQDNTCHYLCKLPRWVIRRYLECKIKACVYAPYKGRKWLDAFLETAYCHAVVDECRQRRLSELSCMPPSAKTRATSLGEK